MPHGTASAVPESAVIDEFDLLFRYWALRARYDALGAPLTDAERTELLSLVQLAAFDPQTVKHEPRGLRVELASRSGFFPGDLRQMAPELLVVASRARLAPGDRTILTLADAVSGVEYSLPCVVRWVKNAGFRIAGLSVDGAPTKATFAVSRPPAPPADAWPANK